MLLARPSATLLFCVLKDSVPALTAPAADWVIPALTPVVANVTDPVVLSAAAKVSAALLVRLRSPDPNATGPRLVIVLDAAPSDTRPFCVLNDKVPADSAPEPLCVIDAPSSVVVSTMGPLPAFTALITASLPLVVSTTPSSALMVPANIRLPLFRRPKPPSPSVTLPSVVMVFGAMSSETLALLV